MRFADEAVIVTNPEVSSVRDSDRIIGLLDARTMRAERLIQQQDIGLYRQRACQRDALALSAGKL